MEPLAHQDTKLARLTGPSILDHPVPHVGAQIAEVWHGTWSEDWARD